MCGDPRDLPVLTHSFPTRRSSDLPRRGLGPGASMSQAAGTTTPARRRSNQTRAALLMVAPAFLLVAIFTLYPVASAIYESTWVSSPIFASEFVEIGRAHV